MDAVETGAAETPTPDNTSAFLDQLAHEAAMAVLPVEQDESGQPRDTSGRFTKVEKDAPVEEATEETPATPTTEAAVETPAEPEPEPVVETASAIPKMTRDPIIPVKVKIGEQDFEGIPDLTVTWTGPGGKVRTEPLDKLTRLASDGIHQEQREQRYRSVEQEAVQAKAKAEELDAALRQADAYIDAILADEGRYLAEKDTWDRRNTPEARAQQLQQELEQERNSREMDRIAQQGQRYFDTTLTPALDTIAKALPMVTPEELAARMSLEVSRLQGRRGYVLPEQYEDVNRFLVEELAPWAKQLNESRAERFQPKTEAKTEPKAPPPAATPATDPKVEAQKQKNQVAKQTKPVGKAAPDSAPKKRVPLNADEAMDDAVEEAVQAALRLG